MTPKEIADALRIGLDVATFLSKAIPKLIELFQKSDSDETKALDALDLALAGARAVNDERLRAKHARDPVIVPPPSFDEPTGDDEG